MGQRKDDGHKKSRWAAGRQQEDRNAIPSRTSGADQIQRGNKAKSGDGFRIAAPTVQAVRKESESKYGKTGMNDTLGSIAVSPGEIIEKYSSGGLDAVRTRRRRNATPMGKAEKKPARVSVRLNLGLIARLRDRTVPAAVPSANRSEETAMGPCRDSVDHDDGSACQNRPEQRLGPVEGFSAEDFLAHLQATCVTKTPFLR
jgi:hypothetical protein